jgi:excisionase family DNA binding protein
MPHAAEIVKVNPPLVEYLFLSYKGSMRDMLTTKEAAARLGISRRRVNDFINEARLPAEKFGRDHLIKESDLKLVEDRKPGRPPKAKEEKQSVKNGSKKEGSKK